MDSNRGKSFRGPCSPWPSRPPPADVPCRLLRAPVPGSLGTAWRLYVLAYSLCHLSIHSLSIYCSPAFSRQGAKRWRRSEQTSVLSWTHHLNKQLHKFLLKGNWKVNSEERRCCGSFCGALLPHPSC